MVGGGIWAVARQWKVAMALVVTAVQLGGGDAHVLTQE